jgi:hypothetical protein
MNYRHPRSPGRVLLSGGGWTGGSPINDAPPEWADVGRLGRRLLHGAVRAARAEGVPTLSQILHDHLGPSAPTRSVVEESWPVYEHVNVQAGLDAWLAGDGREQQTFGVAGFQHRMFGLADLLQGGPDVFGMSVANVATVNLPCGPEGAVQPATMCAVYLITESQGDMRSALLLRGADMHGPHEGVSLQVTSTDDRRAAAITGEIRRLALEHNVFRGQVLSFDIDMFGPQQPLSFHTRPHLHARDLVLPPGLVEAIEQQVVGVARHAHRLRAAGQHLKRGLLLYGPPGTGKTHTVRYLISQLADVTVIQLSGRALQAIGQACSIARALQPAMVVVEDVDLIAEDRGAFPGQQPLLFELLNEMDGLREDTDVVFVLTTNRPDLLEPALAARPGRVDQAIEFDVPDAAARRQLLELYRAQLQLDISDLDDVIERTEGVTASFLKELLRRSALLAAVRSDDGTDALSASGRDVRAALDDLLAERNTMTRVLLGAHRPSDLGNPMTAWLQRGPLTAVVDDGPSPYQ